MYREYNNKTNCDNSDNLLIEINNDKDDNKYDDKDDDTHHEHHSYSEYNNKHNYKQDYECIYEYSIYDMEMDLLNTYSSLYMFHMNTIKDIKTIDKIEKQYTKIKNKKEIILNENLKQLINDIDIIPWRDKVAKVHELNENLFKSLLRNDYLLLTK